MNTVILGAGLAGLSAAYHGDGLIYEREKEIGGKSRSPKVKGYTFDMGIHVLHTKNNYVLSLLSEKLMIPLHLQYRKAWICSYKRLTRYPFQANAYGLPLNVVKDCLFGFMQVFDVAKTAYDNYQDWIYCMFGKGIAEHFFIPYSEKFWTVSPKEMTADWPDLRIPRPSIEEVLKGAFTDQKKGFGPNRQFRYPAKDGICALPNAFDQQNLKIHLNKQAVKIDTHNKEIIFSDGSRAKYRNLISTIPLPELVKIIHNSPYKVSRAAADLKYNSIFCVNLGIKKHNLNNAHWIYYPEDDYSFFRISFSGNFSSDMVPYKRSSITSEVSYSKYRKIDKKNIVDKVINDLIKAKIMTSRDKIDLIDTRDIKYAYVIYDHNRIKNLSIIKKFLADNDIYTAGRYGNWAYYWMDEAILDGKRVSEQLKRDKIKDALYV